MSKYFVKNISNILRGKYTRNLLHHAKQSATDEFKTDSKRVIQKKAEATGDLIGNKITNRIIKVSKRSPHDSLETVKNENDKEIPTERYISPEERHKIIDDLRLI